MQWRPILNLSQIVLADYATVPFIECRAVSAFALSHKGTDARSGSACVSLYFWLTLSIRFSNYVSLRDFGLFSDCFRILFLFRIRCVWINIASLYFQICMFQFLSFRIRFLQAVWKHVVFQIWRGGAHNHQDPLPPTSSPSQNPIPIPILIPNGSFLHCHWRFLAKSMSEIQWRLIKINLYTAVGACRQNGYNKNNEHLRNMK